MLQQMLSMIISTVGNFLAYVLLFRLVMLLFDIPFNSPIGLFVLSITNPLVLRIRRFVRPFKKLDMASALALWGVVLSQGVLLDILHITDWQATYFLLLIPLSFCKVGLLITELYTIITILHALLSWLLPATLIQPVFCSLTDPFLNPLRKMIRPIKGIDISPLIFLLILQVIRIPLQTCIPLWW